ncbi:hypothetical protein GH714_027850 [Hevea brasiliensis]|uniref:PLAC8 family protein n=1 Tax=Hevea brasiliensis TaxID=3981 RepID=A0A6A6ME29_HEVBR|nr:hypothetical protein GH714_027850 [Hevea brasiliensis]
MEKKKSAALELGRPECGWTANGLPLNHASVVGQPMGRAQWDSSVFACLGRNDEFCSSDLEVSMLRDLDLAWNLCQSLLALHWTILDWFDLQQGSCEALNRSCGCCGSCGDDELQREQCESACDFATHVFCHPCALCQEGREIRRRLPHPGFNARPVLVMIPPGGKPWPVGLKVTYLSMYIYIYIYIYIGLTL